ncbi:MAG: Bug family tripartite tricarboxylate transporter substrate binding protein [Reyranella sp.]
MWRTRLRNAIIEDQPTRSRLSCQRGWSFRQGQPYRGSGPAMIDVISGHVTCMFDILVTALPQIRSGKLRTLTVANAKRRPFAPDIPTMAESGVADYTQAGNEPWFRIFAPAGTPRPVVDQLNTQFAKALAAPELAEVLRTQGYNSWTLDPDALLIFIRDDHAKWGKVVRDARLKPE